MRSNGKVTEDIFKKIILPLVKLDVNEGGNFAVLRQIFSALVLSVWYKETLKRSIASELFVDKRMTSGMGYSSTTTPESVYAQHLEAFRVGVFKYIREDVVGPSADEIVPRKYFSGGFAGSQLREAGTKRASAELTLGSNSSTGEGRLYWVRMNLSEDDKDLIDENYYGVENVGGIDFSTEGDFNFSIEREGEGLRFQLS